MQKIMQFIGNHSILSLVWITLLGSVIFTTFRNCFSKIINIASDEAICLINKEDAIIIDLRNWNEYRKGHLANSLNLKAVDIKSGNLKELEKAKSKPIIIVADNNNNSRDTAKNLIKVGFEQVYILKEGISGWRLKNLPLVSSK